jgi:pyridoxal phosphate enzyme (YggS family)
MPPPVPTVDVAGAVAAARRRIAAAAERAGRDPAAVRLVAVSKTVAAERVAEVVAAGVTDLGENRVQEAVAKRPQLPAGVRWHMVGHLQTNKAARAAATFAVVHSVDSVRLAELLAARRPVEMGELDVLLEVELTGLPGHTGFLPGDLAAAVPAIAALPALRLRGLMTMAPPVDDPDRARPVFARLRALRDELEQGAAHPLPGHERRLRGGGGGGGDGGPAGPRPLRRASPAPRYGLTGYMRWVFCQYSSEEARYATRASSRVPESSLLVHDALPPASAPRQSSCQ